MIEMRKFIVKCGLYIACCFLFVNVQALTLTEAELKSRLNQTLNARIGISGVTDEDMNSLVIGVLNTEEMKYQGSIPIKYEVKNDALGHYIQLTTSDVVREPVMTFTLELDWTDGHLLRDYTLLLDLK